MARAILATTAMTIPAIAPPDSPVDLLQDILEQQVSLLPSQYWQPSSCVPKPIEYDI